MTSESCKVWPPKCLHHCPTQTPNPGHSSDSELQEEPPRVNRDLNDWDWKIAVRNECSAKFAWRTRQYPIWSARKRPASVCCMTDVSCLWVYCWVKKWHNGFRLIDLISRVRRKSQNHERLSKLIDNVPATSKRRMCEKTIHNHFCNVQLFTMNFISHW